MPTAIHSFSQEEMMAYLDGELSAGRALAAAQHLEQCRECQRLAADFQGVSRGLADWEVEAITSVPPKVEPEAKKKRELIWWKWPSPSIAGVAVLVLIGAVGLIVGPSRREMKPQMSRPVGLPDAPARSGFAAKQFFRRAPANDEAVSNFVRRGSAAPPPTAPLPGSSGPLIVRTAQLTVTSKNFDQNRGEVEHIASVNQGYISQLEFTTPNGAGRTLNATMRVPAAQLEMTLQELRRLGRVEEESQGGEDVTQRYVDVNARLANLRTTEDRLLQILRERTGRLADVLQVEEAVDRTRGEIEVTEAEQKMLSGQIALAMVNLRITEEYKAALESGETSALTRLRNAAVRGYRNVVAGVMGILEFLLSTGPALVIAVAIGFFPARWLWRMRSRA